MTSDKTVTVWDIDKLNIDMLVMAIEDEKLKLGTISFLEELGLDNDKIYDLEKCMA